MNKENRKHKRQRVNISDDGKTVIAHFATRDVEQTRGEVALDIEKHFRERGWPVPQYETLERLISHYRNQKLNPQDEPWSLATLDTYCMSPQGIVLALEVLRGRRHQKQPLTIREAKWLDRFSALLGRHAVGIDWNLVNLSVRACQYAEAERLYHLIGRPFNSYTLDSALASLPYRPDHLGEAITTLAAFRAVFRERSQQIGMPNKKQGKAARGKVMEEELQQKYENLIEEIKETIENAILLQALDESERREVKLEDEQIKALFESASLGQRTIDFDEELGGEVPIEQKLWALLARRVHRLQDRVRRGLMIDDEDIFSTKEYIELLKSIWPEEDTV